MRSTPRLLVACSDADLLNDIVAFCEETAGWQLIVPASSVAEAERVIEEEQLDALVCVEELMASALPAHYTGPVIAVSRQESPSLLREALKAGARGFVHWPQERRELMRIVGSVMGGRRSSSVGELVAVWAPKGGSGASVIAAHLAAGIAAHDKRCVLADVDVAHADQASLLGADSQQRGLMDLVRVVDELSPRVLESLSYPHPAGFRAVLSSGRMADSEMMKNVDLVRALVALTELTDHVLVDVGSGLTERAVEICSAAHQVLVIVTPDVSSIRRARDAVAELRQAIGGSCEPRLVVNCASAGRDISASDASAVIGIPLALAVREDIGLLKSAAKGELAPSAIRLLDPLARLLCGLPSGQARGLFKRRD